MKPLPHHYEVKIAGADGGYANLTASGLPSLSTAPPPDFDGPGDAWSPESLLLAAVESCYVMTFRAVARASRVAFDSLEVEARGTVDRSDGATRFTEIVLRPRLTVAAGTDPSRALRTLQKAEKACLVAASLATPVRLEPEVVAR